MGNTISEGGGCCFIEQDQIVTPKAGPSLKEAATRTMAASNRTVGGSSSFSKAAIKRRETTTAATTAHSSNFSKSLGMGRSPTGLELGNTSEMEAHHGGDTRFSFSSMSSHSLADAEEEEEEDDDAFVEHRNTLNSSRGVTNHALDPISERENGDYYQSLENNASLDDVNSTVNAIYYRTASQRLRAPNNEQRQ
mmetsp:Transcript_20701/g.30481  ORF Transcript_20701/g.30481 Transcript_20701/m.30481 type:complete len:194 (-) Transcript_20701:267-848(-)